MSLFSPTEKTQSASNKEARWEDPGRDPMLNNAHFSAMKGVLNKDDPAAVEFVQKKYPKTAAYYSLAGPQSLIKAYNNYLYKFGVPPNEGNLNRAVIGYLHDPSQSSLTED